jgi:hypothetical protein
MSLWRVQAFERLLDQVEAVLDDLQPRRETTGRAAEVMTSNVGGMNAAARRLLRSNLIRCIVDPSVDTPLDDDRDLL